MAKLCETCPLRGNAVGELATAISCGNVTRHHTRHVSTNLGRFGVLVDENRNISKVMKFPDIYSDYRIGRAMMQVVDNCPGPLTREVSILGIFRKREIVVGCGALRTFTLNSNSSMEFNAARQIVPFLADEAQNSVIPACPDTAVLPQEIAIDPTESSS